jgi:adenine-specific DNA-methyltransferase
MIRTVPYKGSKKKLLNHIEKFATDIEAKTVFDGFSGCGVVSAHMRTKGYTVAANDLNYSSYLYSRVFLEGYDEGVVEQHLKTMNALMGHSGWVTANYSGTAPRVVRGTAGSIEDRPLGFTRTNSKKIDAAREYVAAQSHIAERDRNALTFSVILGANDVFNNTSDQKSAFKAWMPRAKKDVIFQAPTLIEGPAGTAFNQDIYGAPSPAVDMVYLDPPYTHGVLYASCYHLNDSLALWDKPELNGDYAVPRPARASFRGKGPGKFYSKKTIEEDFKTLLTKFSNCKRVVLSYSDAPRNTIKINKLIELCEEITTTSIYSIDHKICTQFKKQTKWSDKLKEFFVVMDF